MDPAWIAGGDVLTSSQGPILHKAKIAVSWGNDMIVSPPATAED